MPAPRRSPLAPTPAGDGLRAFGAAAVVLLALLGLATLLVAVAASREEAERWVRHTLEVRGEAEETVRLLVDAETGQRGFLLTGRESHLEPYEVARQALADHLRQLRTLTQDNPGQQARLEAIAPLVEAKMAELAETIALQRAGDSLGALALVRTDAGADTMVHIRALMGQLRAEEDRLLDVRRAALAAERTRFFTHLGFGLLFVATVIGGAGVHLHQSRRAVARREAWFRGIFEAASEGIWILDAEGRITMANPAMAALLGYRVEELLGHVYWDSFAFPEDRKTLMMLFERRRQGVSEEADIRLRNSSGAEVWMLLSARSIWGPAGRYAGALDFFTDITQRRRAEARTRFLAELGAHLLGQPSPDALLALTTEAVTAFFGAQRCAFEELDAEAGTLRVVHQHTAGLSGYPPVRPLGELGTAANTLLAGRPVVVPRSDAPSPTLGGARAWVLVPRLHEGRVTSTMCLASATPREWPPGDIELLTAVAQRGWLAVDKARAEVRLRENAALLRAVAEAVPDAMYAIDREHRCILANPATLASVGAEHLLGTTVRAWGLPPAQAEAIYASDERVLAGGRAERVDEEVGSRVFQSAKVPLRGPDGRVTGLVGVSRDITDERSYARMLERTVAERTEELRASLASLEELLYSIAHDLRAPNRVTHGFAELLELEYADRLDPRARLYLGRIRGAAERNDGLIRDLLRYGQLAHTDVPLATVDLGEVVRDALLDQEALVREKAACVRVAEPLPRVCGNAMLLRQLLANLVGNALTYVHPEGVPEVEVSAVTEAGMVEVRVDDNGTGLDLDQAERVFEPFARQGATEMSGVGIGLAIVRRAAERMRGAVGVGRAPAGGCRFWVRLPSTCTNAAASQTAAP